MLIPEFTVNTGLFEQLFVGAGGTQAALIDDDDPIGVTDDAQAVRDDDNGAPPGNIFQIAADDLFTLRVESTGCFVKNQYGRIGQQGAGDRQTLFLSAGKVSGVFFQHGIVAPGKFLDELIGAGKFGGVNDLFQRGVLFGQ